MEAMTSQFAERLRVLRKAKGLTQAELAAVADLHRQAVAKLELGEREPAWGSVLKLCTALGCTPNDFLAKPTKSTAAAPRRRRPAKRSAEKAKGKGKG